ncbi:MAG: two-component regulator propeller domain-containing protein [Flavihumibacter sp.]
MKTVLFLCCLLLQRETAVDLKAQPYLGYQFENFTVSNGLSDNRVSCFFKDRTGFMWIGTQNGLNRFDGRSFLVYNTGNARHYISHPVVHAIAQDTTGRLWVATQSGLNIIDLNGDSTTVLLPGEKTDRSGLVSDLIWDIYIDRQQRVWMAPDMRDFGYYDVVKKKFVYFPWLEFVARTFPHHQHGFKSIRKIFYKSENELWLGTALGLVSFNTETGRFLHWPSATVDHFIALSQADNGRKIYFVQNPAPYLQELDLGTGSYRQVAWHTIDSSRRAAASGAHLWFPAGHGMIGIDTLTGHYEKLLHETDNPHSLQPGVISVVYRDDNGLIWTGGDRGFGKFDPRAIGFRHTSLWPPADRSYYAEKDAFRTDHIVHTVYYSKADDNFYISSPRFNCLVIMNRKSGVKKIIRSVDGIALQHCSVIYEDAGKKLWILANNRAFVYDRARQAFAGRPLFIDKVRFFTDMADDGNGNYWFTALGGGLYRYAAADRMVSKLDAVSFDLTTALFYNRKMQQLWVGSFGKGIYRIDRRSGKTVQFIGEPGKERHLQSSLITDITGDSAGQVWVSSYGAGIAVYPANDSAGHPVTIGVKQGLKEPNIYSLAIDKNGDLWAANFSGMVCIKKNGTDIKQYSQDGNLHFTDLYGPITVSDNNELFTGAGNGFLSFYPDTLRYTTADFPIVLTQVSRLANQRSFSFAGLSYYQPSQTRYEYRLDPADKNWLSTNEVQVTYNALSPGSYRFTVRAVDFSGRRSQNAASCAFSISPPWWQSWWFIAGSVVFTGLAILFVVRRRIQAIKSKAALRHQLVEMKGMALRAQMNPHFIFNCLNAIQELIVTEDYNASYLYLSKFSRLLRKVLDASGQNLLSLEDELEICTLYVELESLRFQHAFNYSITIDPDIDADNTLFPTLLEQPFVENAIWHGLSQKHGEKLLTVSFEQHPGGICCRISDNGIGRAKSAAARASRIGATAFRSKGIDITQQRLEALQAETGKKAGLVFTDCSDSDGNPCGTTVEIIVPLIEKM